VKLSVCHKLTNVFSLPTIIVVAATVSAKIAHNLAGYRIKDTKYHYGSTGFVALHGMMRCCFSVVVGCSGPFGSLYQGLHGTVRGALLEPLYSGQDKVTNS